MEAKADAAMGCFPSPRGFDPNFKNGAITVSMMPLDVRTLAIDDKGRYLIAGAQGSDAFIARITPDGKVDTTFGTKGVIVQSFSATADVIRTIALDAQHRIVVGGGLDQGGSEYAFVARFSIDGALDATFTTWISSISLGDVRAIAIDSDGLYAMGASHFVQRIQGDGTTDAAFMLVQAPMGENIAGTAVSDGVIVFDNAGAIAKYGKNGMPDAAFGGPIFGPMATGGAFATNGSGFIVSDGAKPAHLATLDDKGKVVQMSESVSMSIASIGVACNRIVLGGGSNGDAAIGLLGLDTKPVTGDKAVDSYPVTAPVDSATSALFSIVQTDGRVVYVEGVGGTGAIEMARVGP